MRLSVGNVHSITYMRQIGRCQQVVCTLSVTVVCCGAIFHLHEADWRVFAGDRGVLCQLLEAYWLLSVGVYSVIYMKQIGGCPDGTGGVLCHLQKARWRLSAGGGTLSVTRGRLAVVCKAPVYTLSATLGRLSDVRVVCVNYVSYFRKLEVVCRMCVIS